MHCTLHYTIRHYTSCTSYRLFLRQTYCLFLKKKESQSLLKTEVSHDQESQNSRECLIQREKKCSDDSLHLSNSSMCYYTFDKSAIKSQVSSFDEIHFQAVLL